MSGQAYLGKDNINNFLDHFLPVPDDFNINPSYLCGLSKSGFIQGLNALTLMIQKIYLDIIQKPVEYGLPLAESVEHKSPKARESRNSSHRLIALLHALVNNGKFTDEKIVVNAKSFAEACKKLPSMYKIANSGMIINKLCGFGFATDGFEGKKVDKKRDTFTICHSDKNVTATLYGYLTDKPLTGQMFSMNYHILLSKSDLTDNIRHRIFAGYLSGDEREFYIHLYESLKGEDIIVYDFNGFNVDYRLNLKYKRYVVRCTSDYGKLWVDLVLRKTNNYNEAILDFPDKIIKLFRKKADCESCNEGCTNKFTRIFEGKEYQDCGCKCHFNIGSYKAEDIEYYKKIILLEAEAARKK
jgi:hypothetical protein